MTEVKKFRPRKKKKKKENSDALPPGKGFFDGKRSGVTTKSTLMATGCGGGRRTRGACILGGTKTEGVRITRLMGGKGKHDWSVAETPGWKKKAQKITPKRIIQAGTGEGGKIPKHLNRNGGESRENTQKTCKRRGIEEENLKIRTDAFGKKGGGGEEFRGLPRLL